MIRASLSAVPRHALTTGLMLAVVAFVLPPAGAQTIRCWVNPNGSRECSDQPPPSSAKDVKDVRGRAGAISSPEPFAQRQAAERFPVTLWVNACGEVCDNARKLLVSRGVPFTERNPDRPELQAEFKKVSRGRGQVPLLIVGTSQIAGFEESQWNTTLDAAGYSRTPVGPLRREAVAPAPATKPAEPPAGGFKPIDAKNSGLPVAPPPLDGQGAAAGPQPGAGPAAPGAR